MIPIPVSTPQIFVLLIMAAAIFIIALFFPAILELKKPRDSGPRRILESDGREIIGFDVLLAVYFREKSREAPLLEDIEPLGFGVPSRSIFSIPLPDIEF